MSEKNTLSTNDIDVPTEPQVSTSTRGVARLRRLAADRKRANDWIASFIKHWNDQPLTTLNPRPWRSGSPSLPVWRG